jgi:hypothetical protein
MGSINDRGHTEDNRTALEAQKSDIQQSVDTENILLDSVQSIDKWQNRFF